MKLQHLVTVISLLTSAVSAQAAMQPNPYFTASGGYARADLSEVEKAVADEAAAQGFPNARISSDESSATFAGGVGVRVNEFVAFELQYMHLGDFELDIEDSRVDIKMNGPAVGLLGYYPLSKTTSLYARADAINIEVEAADQTAREWQPALGIGIEHDLGTGLKLRGQYQHVFLESDDIKSEIDNVTVGVVQSF